MRQFAKKLSGKEKFLVFSLPLLVIILARSSTFSESDVFWSLRSGQDILNGFPVVRADVWSWSSSDSWIPNAWLWNVLLAGSYSLLGFSGVGILSFFLTVFLYVLFFKEVFSRAKLVPAFLVLILSSVILFPWLGPRAQLLTYSFSLLALFLSKKYFLKFEMKYLFLLFFLQVLAINFHFAALSFVLFSLGASFVYLLQTFLYSKKDLHSSNIIRALLPTLSLLVASFLTFLGPGIISHSLSTRSSSFFITEWMPGYTNAYGLFGLGLGILAFFLTFKNKKHVNAGFVLVAFFLTLSALRFLPFLVIFSAPEIAAFLSSGKAFAWIHSRTKILGVFVNVIALFLLPAALMFFLFPGTYDKSLYSLKAVKAIPSDCRLLNSYIQGGFILFERPDVLVSMDSRNDLYKEKIQEQINVFDDKANVNNANVNNANVISVQPAGALSASAKKDLIIGDTAKEISTSINDASSSAWLEKNKVNCIFAYLPEDNVLPRRLQKRNWKTIFEEGNWLVLQKASGT